MNVTTLKQTPLCTKDAAHGPTTLRADGRHICQECRRKADKGKYRLRAVEKTPLEPAKWTGIQWPKGWQIVAKETMLSRLLREYSRQKQVTPTVAIVHETMVCTLPDWPEVTVRQAKAREPKPVDPILIFVR